MYVKVNVIVEMTLNAGGINQPTFQHYCLLQGRVVRKPVNVNPGLNVS